MVRNQMTNNLESELEDVNNGEFKEEDYDDDHNFDVRESFDESWTLPMTIWSKITMHNQMDSSVNDDLNEGRNVVMRIEVCTERKFWHELALKGMISSSAMLNSAQLTRSSGKPHFNSL